MQGLQRTFLPTVLPVPHTHKQKPVVPKTSCSVESAHQHSSSRRQLLEAAVLTAGVSLFPIGSAQAAGADAGRLSHRLHKDITRCIRICSYSEGFGWCRD